jgi:methylmalonyl-CoA mutase
MSNLSDAKKVEPQEPTPYQMQHKVRFVTAASLFDGHDASINIMRRLLQSLGAEVIHLGHNRSVDEIVTAALEEDVQGIAVSSYQGGHNEFFRYMVEQLRARGGAAIKVFGGGGGVIIHSEIKALQDCGVERIYSPEDGQKMGLQGMIADMIQRCDMDLTQMPAQALTDLQGHGQAAWRALSRTITAIEAGACPPHLHQSIATAADRSTAVVLGVTGTGGAGKSSLTDELIRRFRLDMGDQLHIAVISIDPSRRKSGGALLGDRIRMNAINPWPKSGADGGQAEDGRRVFMRSLATRAAGSEISAALPGVVAACKAAGFDLVIVETSGIGQGDAAVVPHVDFSLYVMTPDYGAATQLEKIDMLDFADAVAINKFDRKGSLDALRDVSKQVQRNREAWTQMPDTMPVFGTQASRFNDDGVTALYQHLRDLLRTRGLPVIAGRLPAVATRYSTAQQPTVPAQRSRYLADIVETVRGYKKRVRDQARLVREIQQLRASVAMWMSEGQGAPGADRHTGCEALETLALQREKKLEPWVREALEQWPQTVRNYSGDEHVVRIRDKDIRTVLTHTTLCGSTLRKVSLPKYEDHGELLQFLGLDNLPGYFPFTSGVFPFKREGEDPTRMFAGEGDAFRTNRRFHLLSEGMPAKRLSTAFDSVTLYGNNPDPRPDVYGKVGNSGVSIATLEDMKVLYSGFDLCDPGTSVSMTINGPAPTILAMYLNTAIDQQMDAFVQREGRQPDADEQANIRARTFKAIRGTVQADILKEDQGQNTCIFSTEFSLKVMGDIQQYFIDQQVRNFYSVSISGYHIAEAGANPISQLAFTLSNGFTFVEAYLARGMSIDDFAPNLSFFFSNGMDPEYTVLGRVARRIWAVAMKERYGANERSQKLKYHIQTSGRSLHAQEIAFNDIRTTLQALIAIYDNCNSLHTNAYDEAITTPTEESVRRAMAIQLIINREWGLAKNENPNQGAFVIEELTELVEEAVLAEFERISERGGVLGAMETGYQRGKIQDESMHYEMLKHTGELPIIGVNTFRSPHGDPVPDTLELARSTDDEKQSQLKRLQDFHRQHASASSACLEHLRQTVIDDGNVFAALVDAVRCCSLGQITNALFEVGGQYRRSM